MASVMKLLRRSWADHLWLLEALLQLAWARIRVSVVPFHRLARSLGEAQRESSHEIRLPDRAVAVKVSWAVQAVARHVPLGFVCLPQAVAAQSMLYRRGIATTLYLGVLPGIEKKERFTSHAWLRAGNKIVSGEREATAHLVVLTLAKCP